MEYHITLPSKPRIVSEDQTSGTYEIDALYPGYGHTLGNSLRRIILSSLSGAAVTQVKIENVAHEFSTIEGMRETVMELLLNLKRVHFVLHGDEPQTIRLTAKGAKEVLAKDFSLPSQVEIANPDQHLADLSGKSELEIEATIERGIGYVPRETLTKDKVDIGTIALDAAFTPIRRCNYEVENMRVGDRTDFNRLRILIETNGTLTPRKALEESIETMIHQLSAVIGFQEAASIAKKENDQAEKAEVALGKDPAKMKVADLAISTRIATSLEEAGIKTVAGLQRKTASSLRDLEGIGDKAIADIESALQKEGFALKGE